MTQDQLKTGDVVQLKSGGPRMTYEGKSEMLGDAICVWFDGPKKMRDGFSHSSLKMVEATGA